MSCPGIRTSKQMILCAVCLGDALASVEGPSLLSLSVLHNPFLMSDMMPRQLPYHCLTYELISAPASRTLCSAESPQWVHC